ncbi:MAG: BTAD domain-containing putative transcriptional regulator [Caldilineaceae bacterium]
METQSRLSIRLLGAFELKAPNGDIIDLSSRKAQALCAYLAVMDKPTPRDTLAFLLWPDMADQAAKNNLRTTLSTLKRHLAPYLDITMSTVAFNLNQPHFLDVETFQNWVSRAVATKSIAELQAAVALYRGEFLDGFHVHNAEPFEEWLLQQREHLHLRMLDAFEILVALCVEGGEISAGLAAGQKLLTLEPWSEFVHRQLMILLANSGRRMSALAQYERCRRILFDELGIEPTPETTALYQHIKAGTYEGEGPGSIRRLSLALATTHDASPSKVMLPNNLITPLTRFIGRQKELAFLGARLAADDCRLLTISGLGGIGKTALALALGRRLLNSPNTSFADGIFFVSLAAIERQEDSQGDTATTTHAMGAAIAEAIGCQLQDDRPAHIQLQTYLQPRRLLLILDNCEHLVDYANLIVTLLTSAPNLTMLVTSRVRLNIRGETSLALQGLSMPPTHNFPDCPPASAWQQSEAVALFVERVREHQVEFMLNAEDLAPIAEICRLIDGLPLAIEMIASWLSFYSCAEIAEKLTQGVANAEWLRSPFRDQPARHYTLQRVFADSWALLPLAAQQTLARLSVFTGSFTRQAAQDVTAATPSDLMCLHDHSLLQIDREGVYSLHPLVKQFAVQKWQQLTEHELEQRRLLQQAHSHYYLRQVATLANSLRGKEELAAIHSYRTNHADTVRSWEWAVQEKESAQIQHSMFGLFRYLELTSQSIEGEILFGKAAAQQDGLMAHWLRVAQSHFMRRRAEHEGARALLEALLYSAPFQSRSLLSLVEAMENSGFESERSITTLSPVLVDAAEPLDKSTHTNIAITYIFALCELGWVYYEQGDYEAAQSCFSTAHKYANRMADPVNMTQVLNGLGAVAFSAKRYGDAREYYQAALSQAQQHADLHYTAIVLGNLAALAQTTHAYTDAEHYLQRRLQIDEQTQNERQMAVSYQRLGQLALLHNSYASAEVHFRRSLAHFEQLGNNPEIAHVLLDLSKSLLRQNLHQEAEAQCLRSLNLAVQAQITPRLLAALTLLAEIRFAEQAKDEAALLLQMVNHHTRLSMAAGNSAQELKKMLTEELGAETILAVKQNTVGQSLQEFSLRLLQSQNFNSRNSFAHTTG